MNFISFIIVCFLYSYALILFYITFSAKSKGEKGAFVNNFINSLIFVLSISINLLIVNFSNLSNINFIVFPFDILMIGFIIFFLPLFYIFILNEKRKIKKGKGNYNKFNQISLQVLPLKYDIYRKLTHLVVLGIILFYFTLGFWIQNIVVYFLEFLPKIVSELFYSIFQIERNIMIFTQYLVVFIVGISLISGNFFIIFCALARNINCSSICFTTEEILP